VNRKSDNLPLIHGKSGQVNTATLISETANGGATAEGGGATWAWLEQQLARSKSLLVLTRGSCSVRRQGIKAFWISFRA